MGCKGSKSVQVEDIPHPELEVVEVAPEDPQPPTPPPPTPEPQEEAVSKPVNIPPVHPGKKRPKRDYGIKFYNSSRGQNGNIAKYTYQMKGRTSRVYKAEPASLKTVRRHCQKKVEKPVRSEDSDDLRLIEEVLAQNSVASSLEQEDEQVESVKLEDGPPECDCDCCLEEKEEKRKAPSAGLAHSTATESTTGNYSSRGDSKPPVHANGRCKPFPESKRHLPSTHISKTPIASRHSRESFASNRSTRSTESIASEKSTDRIFLKLDTAPGDYDYHQYRILVIKDREGIGKGGGTSPSAAARAHRKSKLLDRYGIKSPYSSGRPVTRTFRPRTSSMSSVGSGHSSKGTGNSRDRPVTAAVDMPAPSRGGQKDNADPIQVRSQYTESESKSIGSAL